MPGRDGQLAGAASAQVQRCAGRHQDLQEGIPQQDTVRGIQTEVNKLCFVVKRTGMLNNI